MAGFAYDFSTLPWREMRHSQYTYAIHKIFLLSLPRLALAIGSSTLTLGKSSKASLQSVPRVTSVAPERTADSTVCSVTKGVFARLGAISQFTTSNAVSVWWAYCDAAPPLTGGTFVLTCALWSVSSTLMQASYKCALCFIQCCMVGVKNSAWHAVDNQ